MPSRHRASGYTASVPLISRIGPDELYARRWQLLALTSVGAFMGPLDGSIVSVALPQMASSLHLSFTASIWVQAIYLLVMAVLLIPLGRLADQRGRVHYYLAGIIIMIAGVLVIAAIAFGFYSFGRKMRRRAFAVHLKRYTLALFFVTSILVYDALRGDWMPEYRYATPAFLFGPAVFLAILWDISCRVPLRRVLAAALSVALVAAVGTYSFRHTSRFVKSPAISFASVREMTLRIAHTIEPLGSDVAVLTPDIGGALWEKRYRVIDLAGLVDRAIGRTVGRDRQRIRDHLLKERKPEGVWLHSFWMRMTGFNADPAFAEMYAPVWEERPSPDSLPTAGF